MIFFKIEMLIYDCNFVLVENSLSSFLFYVGLCSNYSFDSLFIDNSSRM